RPAGFNVGDDSTIAQRPDAGGTIHREILIHNDGAASVTLQTQMAQERIRRRTCGPYEGLRLNFELRLLRVFALEGHTAAPRRANACVELKTDTPRAHSFERVVCERFVQLRQDAIA